MSPGPDDVELLRRWEYFRANYESLGFRKGSYEYFVSWQEREYHDQVGHNEVRRRITRLENAIVWPIGEGSQTAQGYESLRTFMQKHPKLCCTTTGGCRKNASRQSVSNRAKLHTSVDVDSCRETICPSPSPKSFG